jgi:hypothetical protein
MDLAAEAFMLLLAFHRVDRDKQIRYPRKEIAIPGCGAGPPPPCERGPAPDDSKLSSSNGAKPDFCKQLVMPRIRSSFQRDLAKPRYASRRWPMVTRWLASMYAAR